MLCLGAQGLGTPYCGTSGGEMVNTFTYLLTYLLKANDVYVQTLHEAFSRCASILSQSSRPEDVAVQVMF